MTRGGSGEGAGTRGNRARGSAATGVVILLALAAAVAGVKDWADRAPRAIVPGASLMYIPSGRFLRYASFGFDGLAADAIYIWSIQYFGETRIPDRFDQVERVFSVISDLDPRYVDAYDLGAVIAAQEKGDVELALRILDKGWARNPAQWFFPFQAGHYCQLMLKDWERAREYYRKAMDIPGAPPLVKRLYANASYKAMDVRAAWETWLEVFRTSTDPRVRKFASNHLYQIKADQDLGALRAALEGYKGRYGGWPSDLDALRERGFLPEVPRDMDGRDYAYDAATGKVATAVIPWKR